VDGRVRETIDVGVQVRRGGARLQAYRLHPTALSPLEALVAVPAEPGGLLFHFPGFNVPLGSWEALRCTTLAAATGLAAVAIELPGLSRLGNRLPEAVRRDLRAGRVGSWAELSLTYLWLAAAQAGVDGLPVRVLSGFSTGCSLAVAAHRQLRVEAGLSLVEPVSVGSRSLLALELANLADLARLPGTLARNRDWVAQAWRRQVAEPGVRYSTGDLLAIASMLAGRCIPDELAQPSWCLIARGEHSSLCRPAEFDALDALLAQRNVAGPTLTVTGLGHQLWHHLAAVSALADRLAEASVVAGPGEYPGRPLS
jgi:hypothetical protein